MHVLWVQGCFRVEWRLNKSSHISKTGKTIIFFIKSSKTFILKDFIATGKTIELQGYFRTWKIRERDTIYVHRSVQLFLYKSEGVSWRSLCHLFDFSIYVTCTRSFVSDTYVQVQQISPFSTANGFDCVRHFFIPTSSRYKLLVSRGRSCLQMWVTCILF